MDNHFLGVQHRDFIKNIASKHPDFNEIYNNKAHSRKFGYAFFALTFIKNVTLHVNNKTKNLGVS